MRAFSVLAMLAVAACAVDMQVENPYKDLFGSVGMKGKDSSKTDKDDGKNTVKVDVWDTVDSELGDLMAEVQHLMKIVDEQGSTLIGTRMTFATLMTDIADLRDGNLLNSANLASQNAIDAAQDKKIHKLDDKIEKFEDKVAELTNNVAILKKKVQELPSLDSLTERLSTITENNISLMSMAGIQAGNVATASSTASTLTSTISTLADHNDDFEAAIDAANTKIGTTTDLVGLNQNALDSDLEPLGLMQLAASQTIVANYLEVNDAPIELTDGEITLPTTFTQCDGETLEFHLAMTDEAGLLFMDPMQESGDNELTSITLFADETAVATSTTLADAGIAGYRHSLFYKTTNVSGDTITYSIVITAVGSNTDDMFAMIQPKNLQWGYIMYGDGYVLDEDATTSLCDV